MNKIISMIIALGLALSPLSAKTYPKDVQINEIRGKITLADPDGKIVIDKNDISDVQVKSDDRGFYVELTLTEDGKRKVFEATSLVSKRPDGENYIAVCVNDEIISAPIVTEPINSDTCAIQGSFITKESAELLAGMIISGY